MLPLIFLLFLSFTSVAFGSLRKPREDHRAKVSVPVSHHLVQELAAFAVEEFVSHSFRVREVDTTARFDVLKAEKMTTFHEDNPTLNARNYFLVIRLQLKGGCSVHHTHIVFYPASQTRIVTSRQVDQAHPDCSVSYGGSGGMNVRHPPVAPATGRYISPMMARFDS